MRQRFHKNGRILNLSLILSAKTAQNIHTTPSRHVLVFTEVNLLMCSFAHRIIIYLHFKNTVTGICMAFMQRCTWFKRAKRLCGGVLVHNFWQ